MSKVELKVGFTKVSYLYYRILELDRASNYAKIEEGFEVGDYKLVK